MTQQSNQPIKKKHLLTGGSNSQLLPELRKAIAQASEIEIAVSFIKLSGLNLLFEELADFLTSERFKKLVVLTSDYMSITEPNALRKLMLLKERGADIRIHDSRSGKEASFHLKTYIFVHFKGETLYHADAFVGSSNVSKPALTDGLEWNYHIDYPGSTGTSSVEKIYELKIEFETLLNLESVSQLSFDWIEAYEPRYKKADTQKPHIPPDPEEELCQPLPHQEDALIALATTRERGYQKGLIVLATGMGKTYLSAFDVLQLNVNRMLFVAHREEILLQAEATFQKLMPAKRIGRYNGSKKETGTDLLFASIQTIGKERHLQQFPFDYFDYIVVDEFHHASAGGYQRLLEYFKPAFLLGLTATPDRSDNQDIFALCDHNLVYRRDLYDGIEANQLCRFDYYGIYDASVDYDHIPWRNGKFDPNKLSNKLATQARAKHALKEWRNKGQQRTLAFCSSRTHADCMAKYFSDKGVSAQSVHTESELTRTQALERLGKGSIEVLFSVDLFNEGVDLPQIDTVLMLRPTESKILFLQQLGRGLRLADKKEKLVVLDFVGNHHSFLNRPEMLFSSLFDKNLNRKKLVELAKDSSDLLPDGCFVNFDLKFIEFLDQISNNQLEEQYRKLKNQLNARPSLIEFWKSGANLQKLRLQYGSWWEFLDEQGDLNSSELAVLEESIQWYRDLTTTRLSKSYKLVLLKTLLNEDHFHFPISTSEIAEKSKAWYLDNPEWMDELPESLKPLEYISSKKWLTHWKNNPMTFLSTPESQSGIAWFSLADLSFRFNGLVDHDYSVVFKAMTHEIVEWRMAAYKAGRLVVAPNATHPNQSTQKDQIKYFPDIKIACGHFKTGSSEAEVTVNAPGGYGPLSEERHFIARASGNSMNGGKSPIHDGDYLLLEQITPNNAGSISNNIVAIEREDIGGDNQYLLRKVLKNPDGSYTLRASNPGYDDILANTDMVPFARLKGIVEPTRLFVGQEFLREEIPTLFLEEFNPGNWQAGYVYLPEKRAQVLLVTLNKQGKQADHQYHDFFKSADIFHWQSQNSTEPDSKKGKRIVEHVKEGIRTYLFVRDTKLRNKKAAPFLFYGEVEYISHEGSKPMSVLWKLLEGPTHDN